MQGLIYILMVSKERCLGIPHCSLQLKIEEQGQESLRVGGYLEE